MKLIITVKCYNLEEALAIVRKVEEEYPYAVVNIEVSGLITDFQ